jgi:hypothetical protein
MIESLEDELIVQRERERVSSQEYGVEIIS